MDTKKAQSEDEKMDWQENTDDIELENCIDLAANAENTKFLQLVDKQFSCESRDSKSCQRSIARREIVQTGIKRRREFSPCTPEAKCSWQRESDSFDAAQNERKYVNSDEKALRSAAAKSESCFSELRAMVDKIKAKNTDCNRIIINYLEDTTNSTGKSNVGSDCNIDIQE